jgi:hypothetical protein
MNTLFVVLLILIGIIVIATFVLVKQMNRPKTRSYKGKYSLRELYHQAMKSQDPKFVAYVMKWVRREWGESKSFKLQGRYNRLVGGVFPYLHDYGKDAEDEKTYAYLFNGNTSETDSEGDEDE